MRAPGTEKQREHRGLAAAAMMFTVVIARSEATKQSMRQRESKSGLLRFARNDGSNSSA
jgi:hypothetical protein